MCIPLILEIGYVNSNNYIRPSMNRFHVKLNIQQLSYQQGIIIKNLRSLKIPVNVKVFMVQTL